MSKELDDYSADIRFGEWLRSQRVKTGLALEIAAKNAGLPLGRLKSLEMGLSGRGVTRPEAVKLSGLYGVALNEFVDRAARG